MKNNRNKISVGIVSYNSHDDINTCLESLKKFTDTKNNDLSIYIYDNSSHDIDKTKELIESEYPEVTLLTSNRNYGFGHGHNQIIDQINSDYHLILNPDIKFSEDTISKLAEYMNKNTTISLITPEIHNEDDSIQHLPKVFPKIRYVLSSTLPFLKKYRINYTLSNYIIKKPTVIEICTGCFMFARTDMLKKVGGFDKRFFLYFEDFDLSMEMKKYGQIIYYPLTSAAHTWHRDTKKRIKPFLLQIISMFKFYNKWGIYDKK